MASCPDDRILGFRLSPSDPHALIAAEVTCIEEFQRRRAGSKDMAPSDVRIFFSQDKSLYFVNPLWFTAVRLALKKAVKKGSLRVSMPAFISTWTFKKEADVAWFDEQHATLGRKLLLHTSELKRTLLPQGVREFLKIHGCEEEVLDNFTLSFQHYPLKKDGKKDHCEAYAKQLLEALSKLREAMAENATARLTKASGSLQVNLAARLFGVSSSVEIEALLLAAEQLERSNAAPDQLDEASDLERAREENDLPEDEEPIVSHHNSNVTQRDEEKNDLKKSSTMRKLKTLCSHQATIKNSYGNIILNAGSSTILAGDLPCVTVSWEAAKRLPCWDYQAPIGLGGDLSNDKLLRMIQRGAARKGGAWTLHFWFNEAAAVPPHGFASLPDARTWLKGQILRGAVAYFRAKYVNFLDYFQGRDTEGLDEHGSCSNLEQSLEQALDCERPLQGVLDEVTCGCRLCRWIRDHRGILPATARWVTAVHRHAMTGDLVMAVRHPITQQIPHFLLMVDVTILGLAIHYPPQFVDLVGADYDGDQMELVIHKSQVKREFCRKALAVPSLVYNALGRQVVKLSGVAPLTLNVMQSNGLSCPDCTAVELPPAPDRVLWRGLLETTYAPSLFFECLQAVGMALPRLLQLWRKPSFEERYFYVHVSVDARTLVLTSQQLGASHDGYFPVPCEGRQVDKEAWIDADLRRHMDHFPVLVGRRFRVQLSTEHPPRPSALNGLTFAQMRSLMHVFIPSNFEPEAPGRLRVAHVPRLVEHGIFQSYTSALPCPWHRLSRALLRLGCTRRFTRGAAAVLQTLRRFSWKPSVEDLAGCLLGQESRVDSELLRLLELPESLQRPARLKFLAALHHHRFAAEGHVGAAELLWWFAGYEPSLDLFDCPGRSPGAAFEQMHISHHWKLVTSPWVEQGGVDVTSAATRHPALPPVFAPSLCRDSLQVSLQRGRMLEEDWRQLGDHLERVLTVRYEANLYMLHEVREKPALLNWLRLVLCVKVPLRSTLDVEQSLQIMRPLYREDRDFCMVLTNLEALGHHFSMFLNQPKQRHIILDDDIDCRIINLGMEEASGRVLLLMRLCMCVSSMSSPLHVRVPPTCFVFSSLLPCRPRGKSSNHAKIDLATLRSSVCKCSNCWTPSPSPWRTLATTRTITWSSGQPACSR